MSDKVQCQGDSLETENTKEPPARLEIHGGAILPAEAFPQIWIHTLVS
jgi:hypothetical protein